MLARGIHPTTVKTTLDRVYEVLRYLATQGAVLAIPVRPALRQPDPLPRHLTPQELLAIETTLDQVGDSARPDEQLKRALYSLLCHAGLRISEALDLQVQDLDLAVVCGCDGKVAGIGGLSTARATTVLGAYWQSVPHAAADLVLSWQGRPLHYEDAVVCMWDLGVAAGVAGVSPHRLRHTYATQLLNNGMTIDALRRLMGS